MECGELVFGKSSSKVEGDYLHKLWSGIQHGCEAQCLNENELEVWQMSDRSMVITMCRAQLKDRKSTKD